MIVNASVASPSMYLNKDMAKPPLPKKATTVSSSADDETKASAGASAANQGIAGSKRKYLDRILPDRNLHLTNLSADLMLPAINNGINQVKGLAGKDREPPMKKAAMGTNHLPAIVIEENFLPVEVQNEKNQWHNVRSASPNSVNIASVLSLLSASR
jgi:hypothetical protein